MQEHEIREILIQRYIAPTRRKGKRYAGIEVEMPIVNLRREAVDFDVVHKLADAFDDHFGFVPAGFDDDGNIYISENKETGDTLSFDCSYNNIELSLGRVEDLNKASERFFTYYDYIEEFLGRFDHTLTGMGVNPYREYNNNVPIPNGRYRMLYHHLHSYPKYRKIPMHFHPYPAFGTFASASQVQLDVTEEEILAVLRAFSRVEPIKVLLFANSVLLGEQEELICARDMFWENSTHGINPHNVGMYEVDFYKMDELLDYIESTSIYCVERGDKYINFEPVPILEYLKFPKVVGEYYDKDAGEYKEIEVIPEKGDLNYLRTFKFEDLTYRGTIEFRSCCTQPIKDTMTVAAFHLGLQRKLKELDRLLENDYILYHHGYTANELRHLLVRGKLPPYAEEDRVWELVRSVLDLSKNGLIERGKHEERMLDHLYERVNHRTNPAQMTLKLLREGKTLEEVVKLYAMH